MASAAAIARTDAANLFDGRAISFLLWLGPRSGMVCPIHRAVRIHRGAWRSDLEGDRAAVEEGERETPAGIVVGLDTPDERLELGHAALPLGGEPGRPGRAGEPEP